MARIREVGDRGYAPLEQDALDLASPAAKLRDGITQRESKTLRNLAMGAGETSVAPALTQYQLVEGRPIPTFINELAPYTFTWPAAGGGDESRTVRVRIDGNELLVQVRDDGSERDEPWRRLAGEPGNIPDAELRATRKPLDFSLNSKLLNRFVEKRGTERLAEKRWQLDSQSLETKVIGEDARLVAAYQRLSLLCFDATVHLQRFPSGMDELLLAGGVDPINLIPADPATADLVIGFDGVQAYRYTLRFPSGLEIDTVAYWLLLGPQQNVCQARSYSEFEKEVGRPFTTWAAYDLVPVADAVFPSDVELSASVESSERRAPQE